MKKLVLALSLSLVSSGAWAQCTGVFPANTLCGNLSGSPQPPAAFSASGTVTGPASSFTNDLAVWANTSGTQLTDPGKTGTAITSNYTFSGLIKFPGTIGTSLTISSSANAFGINGVSISNLWTGTSANDAGSGGTNTWLGPSAGPQTAGGYSSSGTLGTENVGVGFLACASLTTGFANQCVGGGAGLQITTGNSNTDVGRHSQRVNHAGSNNVILGEFANNGNANPLVFGIFSFTGHVDNGGAGAGTLLTVTAISGTPLLVGMHIFATGVAPETCEIISLGSGVGGVGTYNLDCTAGPTGTVSVSAALADVTESVFIGANAGYFAADPNPAALCGGNGCAQSVGVGYQAYKNGFTGRNNTAIGTNAMFGDAVNGITGNDNVAVGFNSCSSLNSGTSNTCLGDTAGSGVTSASNNTFVGTLTGFAVTTGANNTLIGMDAGSSVTTGSNNTIVANGGGFGGPGITTGSNNLILGGANSLTTSMGNVIILSDGAGNIRADYGKTSINPSAWAFAGGVSCAAGTVSIATFVVTNGLVTHC